MPLVFRILGPLEIDADGRVLPLGSPKQAALLGLLLVHAGKTVSRDRLIEELWGEAPPATVDSALHVYLSRLRRLLESAGAAGALVRERYGYRLLVKTEQLDANRFERLAGEGSEALAAGKPALAASGYGKRSLSGAARLSPTCNRSDSPSQPPPGWRRTALPRWSSGSRPTWPSAATGS
jgi:DNA-binding SARP family transcriptional activator